jgi:hypothetical protein
MKTMRYHGHVARPISAAVLFLFFVCACTPSAVPLPSPSSTPLTLRATERPPVSPTPEPAQSISPSATALSTGTPAVAITPTFALLRGQVLERSNCRYGPGAPYLYFTGLVPGSNLEIIGRREDSQWVYVQAIGGHFPCWVKASQMSIQGDLLAVQIDYPEPARLPKSPYYPPTAVTRAVRNGNQVAVTWLDVPLRAGDEESAAMLHYIIEVWRCQGGQIVFEPLATNDTTIAFTDEPGCAVGSHGRIFVQEKHGFAGPADIPWPPFLANASATR